MTPSLSFWEKKPLPELRHENSPGGPDWRECVTTVRTALLRFPDTWGPVVAESTYGTKLQRDDHNAAIFEQSTANSTALLMLRASSPRADFFAFSLPCLTSYLPFFLNLSVCLFICSLGLHFKSLQRLSARISSPKGEGQGHRLRCNLLPRCRQLQGSAHERLLKELGPRRRQVQRHPLGRPPCRGRGQPHQQVRRCGAPRIQKADLDLAFFCLCSTGSMVLNYVGGTVSASQPYRFFQTLTCSALNAMFRCPLRWKCPRCVQHKHASCFSFFL